MSTDATFADAGAAAAADDKAAPWTLMRAGRLRYIDGLRAVAIVAVVAFHAKVPGFPGGFVGVDIFFVISGFLITTQIVAQALAGRFSATEFYARRITRILPPLLLVTVVVLLGAKLFPLLPRELREIDLSAAATAAMISNYYFTTGTEYFSIASEIQPLLHTWSLGVEEQYYLLAPGCIAAVLALAARRKWSPLHALYALGLATVGASYVTALILSHTDHRMAFYSLMTRAWQFGIGGTLAGAILAGAAPGRLIRQVAGQLGLVAVIASILLLAPNMLYPGFAALLPTTGALLLIISGLGKEKLPVARLLASRPAVTIGVLSYSWYLWHWPLVSFARSLDLDQAVPWKDVAASFVALGLAVPTYWFVERPMKALRQGSLSSRTARRIIAIGIGASAFVAVTALAGLRSPFLTQTLTSQEMGSPTAALAGCRDDRSLPVFANTQPCVVGPAGSPVVLVWGDSHAGKLWPAAEWTAQETGRTAVVLGSAACPPVLAMDVQLFPGPPCSDVSQSIARWVETSPFISGIVLAARWTFYDGEETPAAGTISATRLVWHDGRPPQGAMIQAGLEPVLKLIGGRQRVLIMGTLPEFRHAVADCALRAKLYAGSRTSCTMTRTDVENRGRPTMNLLRELSAKFPNTLVIDPIDAFCDRTTCLPFGPAGVFYSDDNHLTTLGAEMVYRRFQDEFRWAFGGNPGQ